MAKIEFKKEPCEIHGQLINMYINGEFYAGYSPDLFDEFHNDKYNITNVIPKFNMLPNLFNDIFEAGRQDKAREVKTILKGLMG